MPGWPKQFTLVGRRPRGRAGDPATRRNKRELPQLVRYPHQGSQDMVYELRVPEYRSYVRVKKHEIRAFRQRLIVAAANAPQGITLGGQVAFADTTVLGSHAISFLKDAVAE
jgi:hypothetical protein